jgi:flagellar hook-associated protein 2
VGINLDDEGQLSINSTTLRGYLETNFNDVKSLFSANGTTSVGTLDYIFYSRDTQSGEYTVNITQAATQSNSTSDTAVGGTLGGNETLTITEGNKTATIALTSDMTISDIVNAVNTEMQEVHTETRTGSMQLYADPTQTQVITPLTTWDAVYDDTGASAGLQDGDVISFEGTSRGGVRISGSYEISDVTSDNVQGLLAAIESAYGDDVTLSIDSSGRIVMTDRFAGHSELSLTITEPAERNLDFGTVLASNDGGQEGRWAMGITASNDGSDHLKLTHNDYGSNYGFSISETNDLLWTGGDLDVENGQDVAGTINGEAATGSGQTLTGNDGQANVGGLVVKYTGTATGNVGTVRLTLGVGERFDRALFNITDLYEGYVAFKQDSLQSTIDLYETRIEEKESRLDKRMEVMINRFVAMEKALSVIQSQSQWLTAQINSLNAL